MGSRFVKWGLWVVVAVIALVALAISITKSSAQQTSNTATQSETKSTPLDGLADIISVSTAGTKELAINGVLQLNGPVILAPQTKPVKALPGQLYFDETTHELNYYNGTDFVALTSATPATSSGTTTIVQQSGSNITLPLSVSQGGTGATSLAANGVIVGNGTGALSSVTGATGLCLMSTSGAPVFSACPGASGSPFLQNGNSFGATAVLGTNDNNGLNLKVNNTVVASLSATGAAAFQNSSNATNGFVVQNASGVSQLTVNTANSRLYVGNPTPDSTGMLLVLDTKNTSGDPTGVEGAMYYNSNLGQFRCYLTNYWHDCNTPNAQTTYYYENDFTSVAVDNTLSVDATGGGFATHTSETKHPGIGYMDTSGSSTARLWLVPRSAGGNGVVLFGNGDTWRQEAVVRIPSGTGLSTAGSEPFTFRSGFIDDADASSNNGVDGCYFKYTDTLNSGKWQGVCRNNNTESTCDTTIAVASGVWYRLTVVVNAAGTSTDFQINGTSRCQVTTNIPTATGRETNWGISLKKDGAGTASKQVDLDYLQLEAQFGSSR